MKAEIIKRELENNLAKIQMISTTCNMDTDMNRIDLSTIRVDLVNNVLIYNDKINNCPYIFDCKDINKIIMKGDE